MSISSKISLTDNSIPMSNIHLVSYSRLVSMKQSSTVNDLYLQIYKILRVYLDTYRKAPNGGKTLEDANYEPFDPKIEVDIDLKDDS